MSCTLFPSSSSACLGDFTVLKTIGNGSFASVFKVQRKCDGVMYALKKVKLSDLSSREKENALNEVRILASINSPHVIRYKDAFYDDSSKCLCIVMEFAEQGDVSEKMLAYKKRGMFFDESTVWKYAVQILTGLASLHDLKILHRDLKCANIFLGAKDTVKLGDLNVSKIMKRDLAYTQTGTPYYTSPEVWQNHPYDMKCDIWSLGCVLYEIMSQRPPFEARSMEGLFKKVCKGNYSKLPAIYSETMNNFIGLCLKKTPKARPSARELLDHPTVKFHAACLFDDNKENVLPNKVVKGTSQLTSLLSTMKMPMGNFNGLKRILPQAQFEDSIDFFVEEHKQQQRLKIIRPISAQIKSAAELSRHHSSQVDAAINILGGDGAKRVENIQIIPISQRIQRKSSQIETAITKEARQLQLQPPQRSPDRAVTKLTSAMQRNGLEMVRNHRI